MSGQAGLSFLEAHRIVTEFQGGPELRFLFALSGTPDPFLLYLQAEAAQRGRTAQVSFLPFNTLQQHLVATSPESPEVFLLFPWDFLPESDWRTGIPASRVPLDAALEQSRRTADLLRRRPEAAFVYVAAPMPPVTGLPAADQSLSHALESLAASLGAELVDPTAFSLPSYLANGCPIGGNGLGRVAEHCVRGLVAAPRGPAKVLVTDLDETLWGGLVAEEGPDGIAFGPQGPGYRHYIYQTMLGRLRGEGVLLAAVSRNDAEVVLAPFRAGRMAVREDDFVAIIASYHAKSAQIAALAEQLNLGLDAFVYVDDNPVELAEIGAALPQVTALAFPGREEELPAFLRRLSSLFVRTEVTQEDRERTELYRRRAEGMAPSAAQGADLTQFLAGLEMRLVLQDRSQGDRARAVQLINKTNQFNANGRRWSDEEVAELLSSGGRLFTASLLDRTGSHGEILACLIGPEQTIEALVMSCRVFQRRVEFGFFGALAAREVWPAAVRFSETERNEPFRRFLADPAFSNGSGEVRSFDGREFARRHQDALRLFEVSWG